MISWLIFNQNLCDIINCQKILFVFLKEKIKFLNINNQILNNYYFKKKKKKKYY